MHYLNTFLFMRFLDLIVVVMIRILKFKTQ